MRVLINGREMSERIDSLERKERFAAETIDLLKKICYIIGAIALICNIDLLDRLIILADSSDAFLHLANQ